MPAAMAKEEPHFLVVTYPAQGHINPARHLAVRLLRATGARVTLSTAVSACRKMFPETDEEIVDGAGVRYAPYSDGYDDGFDGAMHDYTRYMEQMKLVGSRTLGGVIRRLRDAGTPVTAVVYTLLLSWVPAVAREHGVPAALYWIQPATVLAVYLHFFRGTDGVDAAVAVAAAEGPWAEVRVPGLLSPPALRVRDLPSFLTTVTSDDPYAFILAAFRDLVDGLDGMTVLANTFDAMEPDAVSSLLHHGVDVVPVGPVLSFLDDDDTTISSNNNDLFKQDDDGNGYLEWLDAQQVASVVYISFGSMSRMSTRQIAEVSRAMADSARPFLWVLRKDNRAGIGDMTCVGAGGVVVEWCDQTKVLSHRSVGCFVTHCGWNSTLESVACGVPVVGAPQWTDQGTNAWLVEERLGTGVRAAVSDKDGVVEAGELRRCIDFATSEVVRDKAKLWRDNARAAVAEGGSSARNLSAFVAGRQ